jgi:hypothetical protein
MKNPSPATADDRVNRQGSVIPIPDEIAKFIRLANLLPRSDRRSAANSGIHILTQRLWDKDDEKQAANSVLYLKMYLREWPLALNAFVLWDTVGLYVDVEGSRLPSLDNDHRQPLENMDLLIASNGALEKRIEAANERLDLEMNLVQSATDQWTSCIVGEFEFEPLGICELAFRARQRFFFILAAEELLFALTEPEPEKTLEQLWYVRDFNLSNGLFVDNDRLRIRPPILVSYFLDVPISRIRRCAVCSNYFWAGRKDKQLCSLKCGANQRKRRQRQI